MDPLHLTLRQLQVFAAVARGGSTAQIRMKSPWLA